MNKQVVLDRLDISAFYKKLIPSLTGEPQAVGNCPLHNGKRVSLSVNLDSGLFNCVRCGRKGDIITFYEELRGVDSNMALKELAEIAGISEGEVSGMKQDASSGLIILDSVTPEPINWLWQGRIPIGKLSLFDGDPGLGKSTVTLDLVARVSRGASMPDGSPGSFGGAVLLTLEDGLADTIVPRLNAAGADLSKVAALQTVPDENGRDRLPTVEDIEAIKRACMKLQAKIVVVDPLMAHLDGRINSFRDQDIRRALTPLAMLAEEIGVAVIIVRHLNKASGTPAIYRGGGSIGIAGAARCAFLVAKDPDDDSRRVFANYKNNLASKAPALSFSLEDADGSSRIIWGGISDHEADALLAIPSPEERTALDAAKEFLVDLLSNGPVESKTIQIESKAAGIADATLRRARKVLSIRVEKHGYQGAWIWALPAKDAQKSKHAHAK